MLRVDVLHNSNDFESHELQKLRARVLAAFKESKLPPHWHEWSVDEEGLPYYLRGFDPFSIFINGKKVNPGKCVDLSADKRVRAVRYNLPSKGLLLQVLEKRGHWPKMKMSLVPKIFAFLFVLPFFFLMMLPVSVCSDCWVGYTDGSLESLRQINFSKLNRLVYPALLMSTSLALLSIFFRSFFLQKMGLFVVVLVSMLAVLSSKLVNMDIMLEYGGLGLFLASSIWLCFVDKQPEPCPGCAALRMDNSH